MKTFVIVLALFSINCSKQEKTSEQNADNTKNTWYNTKQVQKIEIDTLNIPLVEETEYSFEGVYPKIKGFPDQKFEELINQEFIVNYKDYQKRTQQMGFVHAYVDFEILTNDNIYISILQRANYVVHEANGYGNDGYVVNIDITNNKIMKKEDLKLNELDIKDYNQKLTRYFKENTSFWNPNGVPFVKTQSELFKYDFAIQNGFLVLAEYADPGARAEQNVYIIPIKNLYGSRDTMQNSANNYKQSSDPSGAAETVKSWIIALGKQDLSTAYNMLSPKARGDYSKFTSTKAYGGITKTNIHAVDVTSTDGCYYVIVAVYDSYDPYNRNGKFTQKFEVSNCEGSWLITSVKNMKVEYFK